MHAVLEGVTKSLSLMSCWFETSFHNKRFYLNRQVQKIDKMLLRIKPPHEVQRTPTPISTTLKHWKASEYRAWILFYTLPILTHFLPSDYVHHLALLVTTMHIFLSTEITAEQASEADRMLHLCCELIPTLYMKELCTYNMHNLLHMTECVRRFGPLWCYSSFGFENFNWFLKKHCHGTRNVLPQMIDSLSAHQSLPFIQSELKTTENEKTSFSRQSQLTEVHIVYWTSWSCEGKETYN